MRQRSSAPPPITPAAVRATGSPCTRSTMKCRKTRTMALPLYAPTCPPAQVQQILLLGKGVVNGPAAAEVRAWAAEVFEAGLTGAAGPSATVACPGPANRPAALAGF